AKIDRLESDHRQAEEAHDRLDTLGRSWLARGRLQPAQHDEFASLLHTLTATYHEHIRLEDECVFVLASRLLDSQALANVGQEMQRRRQADPGRPGSRCAQRRQKQFDSDQTTGEKLET